MQVNANCCGAVQEYQHQRVFNDVELLALSSRTGGVIHWRNTTAGDSGKDVYHLHIKESVEHHGDHRQHIAKPQHTLLKAARAATKGQSRTVGTPQFGSVRVGEYGNQFFPYLKE
jgi:hypothetical protein